MILSACFHHRLTSEASHVGFRSHVNNVTCSESNLNVVDVCDGRRAVLRQLCPASASSQAPQRPGNVEQGNTMIPVAFYPHETAMSLYVPCDGAVLHSCRLTLDTMLTRLLTTPSSASLRHVTLAEDAFPGALNR